MSDQQQAQATATVKAWGGSFWAPRWKERNRNERFEWVALVIIICVGILFRSNRYWIDPIALWGDEAMWTRRMLDQPLSFPTFRPIAFMALCRGLAEGVAIDERVLRLPSYLASIGSIFLFADIGRRLLKNRVLVLVMLAFACAQPMLIDFGKEFKPYAVELFFHLLMLWSSLRVLQQPSLARWVVLFIQLPLVYFFAYNAIFFYPAIFSLLGLRALVAKNKRQFAIVCGVAGACLVGIGLTYFLIFARLPPNENDSSFWGKKYGVFYIDDGKSSQFQWEVDKTLELFAMPGAGRLFWQPPKVLEGRPVRELSGFEELSWQVLYILGLYALVRQRRWQEGALLCLPIITGLIFNAMMLWPWGAFRVNIFLMAYVLPVPFVGLDAWAARGRISQWLAPGFATVVQLLPILLFGFGLHDQKIAWTGHSEIPKILDFMRAEREKRLQLDPQAPKEGIFLDAYTCETFNFYVKRHASVSKKQGEYFNRNFGWRCIYQPRDTATVIKKRGAGISWVIVSKRTLVDLIYKEVSAVGKITIDYRPSYNHRVLRVNE
jgi:hypothetical protein